ncbi:NtaA/DmoA family FMN-dependent monooxygenase [Nocardia sp. NPDC058176]|uniref:NtaA/DmoA family FMN-dependent monooxygenase n=1 Tax=Nocardia sp. NPDC058176 TaxID=3346368 RepID=UPI0036DC56EC
MPRRMVVNCVLASQGFPWEAWRHHSMDVTRVNDLDFYLEQARLAENGRFDALFIVDHRAQFPTPDAALFFNLDPVQLLTAIAAHTTHIGLIATLGTSYWTPYAAARQLATLDHLSRGRAGWNVVTSASEQEARNHGLTEVEDREIRYGRAREFIDACLQLWHSWEPDAITADRSRYTPVDTAKIHAVNFAGEHVQVAGPLGVPRSPQTVPVICQAGPSPAGREIAGAYADLVYAAYTDPEEGRAYRRDLSDRAVASGRPADSIRIVPSLVPFVKSTEAEALAFQRELLDLAPADSPALRSPNMVVGTPEQVADRIATGFENGAYDGVCLDVPTLSSLAEFVETVVPLLQARGVHQREYAPGTLRDKLGLPFSLPVPRERWTRFYAS